MAGFFTEGRGATDCLLCPPGMTTASEGSDECTADDCALGTHSYDILHIDFPALLLFDVQG